jgi:hypothetical protein
MNDSDGTPCRKTMIQKSTSTELDDPGSRRFCLAACDVNGRRSFRA